jgi:hypothetical protein
MTIRNQIAALEIWLAESGETFFLPRVDAEELLESLQALQELHKGLDELEATLMKISATAEEGLRWQEK